MSSLWTPEGLPVVDHGTLESLLRDMAHEKDFLAKEGTKALKKNAALFDYMIRIYMLKDKQPKDENGNPGNRLVAEQTPPHPNYSLSFVGQAIIISYWMLRTQGAENLKTDPGKQNRELWTDEGLPKLSKDTEMEVRLGFRQGILSAFDSTVQIRIENPALSPLDLANVFISTVSPDKVPHIHIYAAFLGMHSTYLTLRAQAQSNKLSEMMARA